MQLGNSQRYEETVHQIIYTNGKLAHKKIFNIINAN